MDSPNFPAMIINGDFVFYNDYMMQKENTQNQTALEAYFIREKLLARVAERIGFSEGEYDVDDIREVASRDIEINKINQLISKDESLFVSISNKFGDELGKVDFKDAAEASKEYGQEVAKLKVDEISDIVIKEGGYYIFKRF